MKIGNRIAELRKERKLTREELGKTVGTSGAVVGRYERNEITPSVETAQRMVKALGISLDFLVGNIEYKLDNEILKKIQDIQNLPSEDRVHIFYTIDNLLASAKTRQAYGS